jgi:Mg-chelatase subunit ChlD
MRIRNIFILVFALLMSACSDDNGKTDSGTLDADGSQPTDSSGDEGEQERAARVLFVVDTSQSMVVDDPEVMRQTEVERAIDRFQADPRISFAVIQMGNQAALLTGGFTRSAAVLDEATQKLNSAGGTSSYLDALGLTATALEDDMSAGKPVPNERTCYRIFLLSDSLLETGATDTEVKDDLASIMSLRTEHGVMELRLHTALLIDPAVNLQPGVLTELTDFLKNIANIGGGTFTDYHDSEAIDFAATVPP